VQAVLTEDFLSAPGSRKLKDSMDKPVGKNSPDGQGGKKSPPGDKKFELLRKVKVSRTADGRYEAQLIAFRSPAGLNWKGYSTGQIIDPPSPDQVKGSVIDVELLSPLEYL
jgi:hypothetical protein